MDPYTEWREENPSNESTQGPLLIAVFCWKHFSN